MPLFIYVCLQINNYAYIYISYIYIYKYTHSLFPLFLNFGQLGGANLASAVSGRAAGVTRGGPRSDTAVPSKLGALFKRGFRAPLKGLGSVYS